MTGAPTKIVFFSHDAELFGASRSLVTLAAGLQERGVSVLIIIPYEGPLVELIKSSQIPYVKRFYPVWFYVPEHGGSFFNDIKQFLRRLKRFFREQLWSLRKLEFESLLKDADCIVTNTYAIPAGVILARKYKKPHIWYIREFGFIDQGLKLITGNRLLSFFLKRSQLLIFNSKSVQEYYQTHFLKGSSVPSGVIYNGLFSDGEFRNHLEKHRTFARSSERFVCCIVGHIRKEKGQFQAAEAILKLVKDYPKIRLIVAGIGDTKEIENLISTHHLQAHVELAGMVKNIETVYLQSDCLLNCAGFEAFGRTTVEAMSYGIPVVGNNNLGTAEIIRHNETGLLYDGTTDDLVANLKRIIDDGDLRTRLGMNGWQEARNKYNIKGYVNDFCDQVNNLLKKQKL
jgi:glycosyltransferase involved in cell wall biosynthesis